jgi:hypothetical protein
MLSDIGTILTIVFWIIVWRNVAAVRKSLANIERDSARIAGRFAPANPEAEAFRAFTPRVS